MVHVIATVGARVLGVIPGTRDRGRGSRSARRSPTAEVIVASHVAHLSGEITKHLG